MTSTLILESLKNYIADNAIGDLANLDVFIDGDQSVIEPPAIKLTVTGSKEHEVLRGVIDFSIAAQLGSVPRANGGTTLAEKDELEEQFYDLLGDVVTLLAWSEADNTLTRIFDARDFELETSADNDTTISQISFTLTGCKI
jgi:hypothetical protein